MELVTYGYFYFSNPSRVESKVSGMSDFLPDSSASLDAALCSLSVHDSDEGDSDFHTTFPNVTFFCD